MLPPDAARRLEWNALPEIFDCDLLCLVTAPLDVAVAASFGSHADIDELRFDARRGCKGMAYMADVRFFDRAGPFSLGEIAALVDAEQLNSADASMVSLFYPLPESNPASIPGRAYTQARRSGRARKSTPVR